ncbi:hypothetical protein HOC99_04765 [Candidatus Woesearchaeota archaeon]|jgi:Flp pilus assembly protein protease CpaA|nr:hypothetical protein [Candidatus Woesearchaeota archaeon]MBT4387213.1 hypothetical protein [Candidatus Woesearchaeota archaeon]MBT4596215.1 hypothetical protein [Candidatus Woesearchaeota archaeon]MBT5741562.1 hypothetical protein [Candidatus Woesearchaeota archaeon]MBT7849352.1 hypothetical protein [Candidatus Woesearchaeota archaeon]
MTFIEIILIIVIFLMFIGTIFDFIKREVPDTISYSIIGISILFKIFESFYYKDIYIIFYAALFGIISFSICYYLTYKNIWGGADSKFLIGICILLSGPINNIEHLFLNYITSFFIIGFIFSTLYLIIKSIIYYKKIKKEIQSIFFNKINIAFILILILTLIFTQKIEFIFLLIMILALLILIFNKNNFENLEKKIFIKNANPKTITEGDILINSITVNNKTINNKPMGLSYNDVKLIKKHSKNKILIRWGIPFIPVFLISFIFLLTKINLLKIIIYFLIF